ncbi:MAG: fasciclin domain-containing protein [Methanomicrobiaceae archaeon]|uniref:Secreted and surface protein n=1 Tax=hydrocarbon metagenome TaxID=938273 RepID=A0A0W8FFH3_9ZZZZ|nr:fasciclin domain-containing protein [Methanomicrobiaceae archaeon]MDD5420408.1 fasciclin domain-containing protein [Methanomicrobiaceae archaeon]
MGNLIETLREAGSFSRFIEAIRAAGLEERLTRGGPYTVFAPTDEAFGRIPEENLQIILADKQMLPHVVEYHIVEGRYSPESLKEMGSGKIKEDKFIKTEEGSSMYVTYEDGTVMLDEIVRVAPEGTEFDNGICYAVDSVLMPTLSQAFEAYAA